MRRRLVHVEILRVIAICLVVFNHTWTSGYMLYSAVGRSYRYYYPLLFLSIFCKAAVPIFFMISGALLLGREESYKELYVKRVARMLLALVFFSLMEYCYKLAMGVEYRRGVSCCYRRISYGGFFEGNLFPRAGGSLLVFIRVSGLSRYAAFAAEDGPYDADGGL